MMEEDACREFVKEFNDEYSAYHYIRGWELRIAEGNCVVKWMIYPRHATENNLWYIPFWNFLVHKSKFDQEAYLLSILSEQPYSDTNIDSLDGIIRNGFFFYLGSIFGPDVAPLILAIPTERGF